MKNFIVGALIIGVAIIVGFAVFGGKTLIEYGASSGPDHYNQEYFIADLIEGGEITTMTATDTAQTITAAQICDSAVLRWDSSGANSTATLPTAASFTGTCLGRIGSTKTLFFENYGGETITIVVSGTSTEILEPSGGDVVIATTEWAEMELFRTASDYVRAVITSIQDAD